MWGECTHQKIFLHRHPGPQLPAFGNKREVMSHAFIRWLGRDVLSIENDFASSDRQQSRERFEKGCLAGAVRSDEADDLPAMDFEAETPHNANRSVSHFELFNFEQSIRILIFHHLRARSLADVGFDDRGIVLHGFGRALGEFLPGIHHDHSVANRHYGPEIVFDIKN
jgi:hypothetical protein